MKHKETIRDLKEIFTEQYSYAELIIHTRKSKGKTFIYFKTIGAHKVDSRRLIECFFADIELMTADLKTLTYKYRGEL